MKIVSMKGAGVVAHHNYTPVTPGGDLESILKVLFQDVGTLERAAVPDSGNPVSSASLKREGR
jgi:hypothetical protein